MDAMEQKYDNWGSTKNRTTATPVGVEIAPYHNDCRLFFSFVSSIKFQYHTYLDSWTYSPICWTLSWRGFLGSTTITCNFLYSLFAWSSFFVLCFVFFFHKTMIRLIYFISQNYLSSVGIELKRNKKYNKKDSLKM